jgi:hypothetical protein
MKKLLVGLFASAISFWFVATVVLAVGLGLTYHNLTKEKPILELKFEKVPNEKQKFIAHLKVEDRVDSNQSKIEKMDYEIYGDQWRVDVIFVKMKYLANILGMESKYVLDRIEGRYKNIKDENSKKHFAHPLEEHKLIDTMGFLVDTTYGSSVYKDIEVGTRYTIFKTPTGVMVREYKKENPNSSMVDKGKEYLKDVGSKIQDVGSKLKNIFN